MYAEQLGRAQSPGTIVTLQPPELTPNLAAAPTSLVAGPSASTVLGEATPKIPFTRPVLAVVDRSENSIVALQRADSLAQLLGVNLQILQIIAPTARIHPFFFRRKQSAVSASSLRKEQNIELTHRFCELMVARELPRNMVHVREGEVVEATLQAAAELDVGVIVVGELSQHKRRNRRALRKLIDNANRPVLLARPKTTSETIVAATDFSSEAFPALVGAADLGSRKDAPVVFVHNVSPFGPMVTSSTFGLVAILTGDPLADVVARRRTDLNVVAKMVDGPVEATVLTRESAKEAILETARARDADLVVVGSHCRRWLGRLASSRTATSVALNARRSVLVVPLSAASTLTT